MLKYPILAGGRIVAFSAGGYLPHLPSKEGIRNSASSCQCACAPAAEARNFQCSWGFLARFRIGSCLWTEFVILLMRGIVSRYAEIKRATAQVVGVRVLSRASTAKAHAAIRDVIVGNPTLSYQQIAELMGCSRWLIYRVAVEFGVRRARGAGSPARRNEEQ